MNTITYVTGNKHKVEEAKQIIPGIVSESVDITEIQGESDEVALDKAAKAYRALKKPILVDDVSFCIARLGGLPGPYVKYFCEQNPLERIGELFAGSEARAACRIVYKDKDTTILVRGIVKGSVVHPRGESWGFDPVFQPAEHDKTWAELGAKKNKISHRYLALQKMRKQLEKKEIL